VSSVTYPGRVTTYAYDALDRLSSKTYSNSDPAAVYTCDDAGRLGSITRGSVLIRAHPRERSRRDRGGL
jgi:YD repeat-containing protein